MIVHLAFEFEDVAPDSGEAARILGEMSEACETMRIAFDATSAWVDNTAGTDAADYT